MHLRLLTIIDGQAGKSNAEGRGAWQGQMNGSCEEGKGERSGEILEVKSVGL